MTIGLFQISRADKHCELVKSAVDIPGQCFSEPECVDVCTDREVEECLPRRIEKCQDIWICQNFTRPVRECKVVEQPEKCISVNKKECTTVYKNGKCANITEEFNCRMECNSPNRKYRRRNLDMAIKFVVNVFMSYEQY